MKTSQQGIELIKRFEGCSLCVYLDAVGIPTVAYGHTVGLTKAMVGMPITQLQADTWLAQDLAKFEKKVDKYNPIYHWSQAEYDSLVSFAYNVGNIDGLTAKGTRTRQQIADSFMLYTKAKGVVLNGLVKRRQAERDMFVGKVTYPTLRRGSSGNDVEELQRRLGIEDDGLFGYATETAVKIFQKEHGLLDDGIVGSKTWAKLLK